MKQRYADTGLNAAAFRNQCPGIHFGRELNAAAFSHQCRGIQTRGKIWVLAEAPMPRHSSFNAAALTLRNKNLLEVSMPNAAAFKTQCRGIHFTREKIFRDRTFNAAAFSAQCRGIQARTRISLKGRDFNAAAFSNECRGIRSPIQKNKMPLSRVLFIFSSFLSSKTLKHFKTQKSLNTQLFNPTKSSPISFNPTSKNLNPFHPSSQS